MENYCLECVENYKRVEERVRTAALKSGRKEDAVQLVAVTKTVAADAIAAVIEAGASIIGENRVQEMLSKKDDLAYLPKQTHIIGHLQSNKAKYLPGCVDMIQSIDSEKLGQAVSKAFAGAGSCVDVLVEVNIGAEDSKSGCRPEEVEPLLYALKDLPGLRVCGLMTIPPICEGDEVRAYFARMYKLFIDMQQKNIDNINISTLSMGMTGDFENAILEGATMVRVGTGIFGKRVYP